MFEHSIKVPRHYKIAANIVKKVATEGGSVKTSLYDAKLKYFRTNVLFALITETVKHAADIDKIFEHCKVLENESRLDPWLAKVLTAELLFGKKALPGNSKPERTILSYKEQFEKYTTDHQDDLKAEVVRRPRYVRINTNVFTTSDAIRAFQDEGFRFIRCTSGSYADYLEQIQKLTAEDFTQDYHVKTMFVFASGTKFFANELYLEKKIVLQDKATAMAVTLLAPPPGSTVLDMCAAPGMKTTQLAAYLKNTGKIYAVERNEKRYQLLCEIVKSTSSQCVETIHKDVLEIKRGEMDDVEYILLDPSCSGSGMDFSIHSYIESSRLAKLTSLQEKFLKHAMNAFPRAKRIVYSTCSLFPEENERVITNVVKTSRAKWRVQDVKEMLKGEWNNVGSGMYGSIGTRCMYARPESDLTTGFFLAVLDRDAKDLEKALENLEKDKNKKRDDSESKVEEENEVDDDTISQVEMTEKMKTKKHKKKNRKDQNENGNENTNSDNKATDNTEDVNDAPRKKKKKRKTDNDSQLKNITDNLNDLVVEEIEVPKKKKKKNKHNDIETNEENMTTNDVENLDQVLDKKKKRKKNTEDNVQTEELQLAPDPVVKKKKNKKADKNISEIVLDHSIEELNEVPKNKIFSICNSC